jgi:hypothetical protein
MTRHRTKRPQYRLLALPFFASIYFIWSITSLARSLPPVTGPGTSPQRKRPFTSTEALDVHYQLPQEDIESEFFSWEGPDSQVRAKVYKPEPEPGIPILDPFPLLSRNPPPKRSLLQAPKINRPPRRHVPDKTPLFIGFTRNWPQLLQCVVSYIAAGWPPADIYVIENTGAMYANQDGKLSLQNPFYLNHTQLAMLGVRVIIVRISLFLFHFFFSKYFRSNHLK